MCVFFFMFLREFCLSAWLGWILVTNGYWVLRLEYCLAVAVDLIPEQKQYGFTIIDLFSRSTVPKSNKKLVKYPEPSEANTWEKYKIVVRNAPPYFIVFSYFFYALLVFAWLGSTSPFFSVLLCSVPELKRSIIVIPYYFCSGTFVIFHFWILMNIY